MSNLELTGEILAKRDVRRRSKESLYYFAKSVLGFDRLTKDLHLPFSNYIQLHPWNGGEWVSLRKIAWMPREHFKSTICSVALPLWLLIHDRNLTIALISAHSDNTGKWLRQIKNIISYNGIFRWAFPEIRRGEKWDEEEIAITRDQDLSGNAQASITAYSINSGLASQHHKYIILDDPVNEQVARSPVEMESAVQLFIHLEEILRGWHESGFLMVGTPWGREDVLNEALKQERRGTRVKWGIGALGDFEISESLAKHTRLIPTLVQGEPILPGECDWKKLEEIKAQDLEKYYMQYLCKPFDEGRNGFDLDLIRDYAHMPDGSFKCDCLADHYHNLSQMAVIGVADPAYTQDKKNCESAFLFVAKALCECRFILEEWGGHIIPPDWIDKATELSKKWVPYLRRFGVETVNFQLALKNWIEERQDRGEFPLNIEFIDLKPKKRDKDTRIAGQITPVANGWWHKKPGMRKIEGRNNLMHQLFQWPYSRLRDRADTFGYVDDAWLDMSVNPVVAEGDMDNINNRVERFDVMEMEREEMLNG